MAHGAPDYSNVRKDLAVFRIDDLGELAARLGSPVRYDRRGDVLWMTGFDYGLQEIDPATGGAASEVSLIAEPVETAPFAAKLKIDAAASSTAAMDKRLSSPASPRVGMGAVLRLGTTADWVRLRLILYSTTGRHQADTTWDCANQKLYVLHSDVAHHTIATDLPDLRGESVFTHFKTVIDFDTLAYERVILGGVQYDPGDHSPLWAAGAHKPHLIAAMMHFNYSEAAGEVYVDNMIVTVNEP